MDLINELEDLYERHDAALCDIEECRRFGAMLARLLERLEDAGRYRLADRVMDILSICSPKIASHCESAERTKGMIRSLIERLRDEAEISEQ
ncbi:hypothetical protein [Methanothrix sp.]|uniref:Uncharacterized protein n=1 Tax=Methanothrix thermoacetophila (strain DSM 6194 / JCM 14653 / NBRC 101360 / PT) TaxID=349307 RepID=A0B767_METTP|nr:hypothetical protein [Methanothrix sp.]ABK14541.1 conserved hypothetical protein [Methanothrix thermoacetophila PT]